MLTPPRLSPDNIEEASRVIDPVFTNTPQFAIDSLNSRLGFRLVCKVELCNPIRSFKGRGADYFLYRLGRNSPGLVCASAGNFGQGLAYAARTRDLRLTVFAAETANTLKLERMRELGADVRLQGTDFDAAKHAARTYAEQHGLLFVEDGRESEISEGAGTIGLELCASHKSLDVVLVPLGNGALINGIGCWMKFRSPNTTIIGVCASGAPAMELSWRSQSVIETQTVNTIADGIAVRVPVPEALEDMKSLVDEVLLVDDSGIVQAMNLMLVEFGLVVEPAGVAGIAAAFAYRERFKDALVATPLCGGNMTQQQMRRWLKKD